MLRVLTIAVSLGLFTGPVAQAQVADEFLDSYFTIESYATTPIIEVQENSPIIEDDCRAAVVDPSVVPGLEDLNEIIAVGEKLWKIFEAGRPVVSFKAPVVHALPFAVTCWHQLEKWQMPQSQLYETVYKNKFGAKVVSFRYRISYAAGGQVGGIGAYLANVTVQPAELKVGWGFDFDAEVEVGRALNTGTHANPVAGLQLLVRWKIKNVMNELQASENFFIQGDGLLKKYTEPTPGL